MQGRIPFWKEKQLVSNEGPNFVASNCQVSRACDCQ